MSGIAAWGAYLPPSRLDRSLLGTAWDTLALPGSRTVRAGDEDALTMGVEAALRCVAGHDTSMIDAIYFATTNPPYAEKQSAATIAAVLDRREVATADVTGSLRAGSTALGAALDAVTSGNARAALVVAADDRPAEPATAVEQLFGDGAAAVLVTAGGPVQVRGRASLAEDFTGPWRRAEDAFVRTFEPKLEVEYGYMRAAEEAARRALDAAGGEITALTGYAPDPRSQQVLAKRLGLTVKDALFRTAGNLGAAHALVALCAALDEASQGNRFLVVGQGEGADAFVLEVTRPVVASSPSVATQLAAGTSLRTYEAYVRSRRLLGGPPDPRSSTVTYWRDRAQALPLYGVRCEACGTVQFPANRACVECSALDRMEPLRLQHSGTIFTYTLDHLVGGEYLETPVPRLVVDLDGGGRIFLEMTEADPSSVAIGDRVELTFRRIHDGAGFHNYYWKARPATRLPAKATA